MDLETGEILWVGQGRGMEDFRKFFTEYDMERLNLTFRTWTCLIIAFDIGTVVKK